MKHYLFVMRRLPHLGSHVQETLDQILTTAAFDQHVAVLFLDDGVLQLKQGQQQAAMVMKNTSAMFMALEMYDIKALYVEAESLVERGLTLDDLILPVEPIPRCDISDLMKRHDVLIPA